ncbi:MAG: hypothetical protein WCT08_06485 [Patescibacteria group bacterium]|jgi:hypothetical protein
MKVGIILKNEVVVEALGSHLTLLNATITPPAEADLIVCEDPDTALHWLKEEKKVIGIVLVGKSQAEWEGLKTSPLYVGKLTVTNLMLCIAEILKQTIRKE